MTCINERASVNAYTARNPDRERQIAAMEDILRQLDAIDAERVRRLRLEEAAAEWALSVIRRERRRRLRAAGRLVDFEEGRRTARRKKQPVN